jgi:hypothetical protein
MAEPAEKDKYVWIEDKIFGYIKVDQSAYTSGDVDKTEDIQAIELRDPKSEDYVIHSGQQATVKTVDANLKNCNLLLADGTIKEKVAFSDVSMKTKLTFNVCLESEEVEKSIEVGLNEPCVSIIDRLRESLTRNDVAFLQLFSGEKLLVFGPPPPAKTDSIQVEVFTGEPLAPKVEKKEGEKTEEKKEEEMGDKPATPPQAEEQPKVEDKTDATTNKPAEITNEPKPEEPKQASQTETTTTQEQKPPVEEAPAVAEASGKQEAPAQPEQPTNVQEGEKEQPKSEEPKDAKVETKPAPPAKKEEFLKSATTTADSVTINRYEKIGAYPQSLLQGLTAYAEPPIGYCYAQCYDHLLITEDVPSEDYSVLISISTPLIFRGIGIVGPAPSIVGKPIMDFTMCVHNLSSSLRSYVKVKREGGSEKCHFYYLEPPLVCDALDQLQVTFEKDDSISFRGRYLKVVKEDPIFFGMDGTKFSIDNYKLSPIAGVCYTLETEKETKPAE